MKIGDLRELNRKRLQATQLYTQKEDLVIKAVQDFIDVSKGIDTSGIKDIADRFENLARVLKTIDGKTDKTGEKLTKSLQGSIDKLGKQLKPIAQPTEITVKNLDDIKIPEQLPADDIFDIYKPAESDEKTKIKYYGFVDKDANWFIFRDATISGATNYRYASGQKDFTDAWNFRKNHDYQYYYEVTFHGTV